MGRKSRSRKSKYPIKDVYTNGKSSSIVLVSFVFLLLSECVDFKYVYTGILVKFGLLDFGKFSFRFLTES